MTSVVYDMSKAANFIKRSKNSWICAHIRTFYPCRKRGKLTKKEKESL